MENGKKKLNEYLDLDRELKKLWKNVKTFGTIPTRGEKRLESLENLEYQD